MKHARSLRFDDLEARQLLAAAHVGVAHPATAVVAAPVALDGTLTVDQSSRSTVMNGDGSWTTSIPVSGQLGNVGKVSGYWNSSVDINGNYEGPDTVQLHNKRGSFTVYFNNQDPGKARPLGHGVVYYQQTQHLIDGTGVYKGAAERGSIDLTTNASKSAIVSLGLYTPNA